MSPATPGGSTRETRAGRRVAFTVAMAALPLAFFVLLEIGLRLAGFGASLPLFVPVPGAPEYSTQNRDVAHRYFSQQARVPTSIGDAFLTDKTPETYRIFVQGGSSAAGYPFYYGGSFSRMLQQRLQQTFPERRIQVVNTAMAAVNSYTLLDFAPEIVAQRPDAVLIYAGHNEFYGALGVGSAESLGKSRWVVRAYLRLQRWRTVQLLRAGLSKLAGVVSGRGAGAAPGVTLMERMVGEQEIALGSPVYAAGIAQFRSNLRELLETYTKAGIRVFVGTVASNERDHPPFLSAPQDGTSSDDWSRSLGQAQAASDPVRALEDLLVADTLAADAPFFLGRALDAQSRFPEAAAAYIKAKDRDRLRFRASEDINRVVREEAGAVGATVVDVRVAMSAASPGGVIDGTLMLEHLHPNLDGYFLMADVFYEALRAQEVLTPWDPISREDARGEVLLTAVDSLFGAYRVLQLKGSWPFGPPGTTWTDTLKARTPLEAITIRLFRKEISWFEATNLLIQIQEGGGDHMGMLQTALAQIQQYPFLPGPYATAGQAMLRQGRPDEAMVYFGVALDIEESGAVREVMGDVHAALGRHAEARDSYLQATRIDAENPEYVLKLGRSHAILGDTLAAHTVLQQYLARKPEDARVARVLAALDQARQ
ncbi:MAG: tetratricopeptide (TPR) repeat protein [Rhodothermales bacterium]